MSRVLLVRDASHVRHRGHEGHPERPERLLAIDAALAEAELPFTELTPRDCTDAELAAVHTANHIALVKGLADTGGGSIDADTYVTRDSYAIARRAAGSTAELVSRLVRGEAKRGMALLRPPGHHATADQPMGFCLFNNVAIAARAAGKRVLIIDWDVHHGNGTQDIFYGERAVGYFSVHEYPLYPGSGAREESGEGDGAGATLNCPVPAGSGDREFLAAIDEALGDFYARIDPELVIVSAGFDAHIRDPLASCEVSTEGYAAMAERIVRRAGETPVAFVLEGGYDTRALAESVVAVARVCFLPMTDDR